MARRNLLALALAATLVAAGAQAGEREDLRSSDAVRVLRQIQAVPESAIPDRLLDRAHGIVVVPGTIKAGFIFGGRRGLGLMAVKTPQGTWSNPVFVKLSGLSVGFQAGAQSSDVVLAFASERGLDTIVNGKFTIGADAGVAAGPIGRTAAAATDADFGAEIFSWSRSKGLFAGVALDGAVLQIDHGANRSVYGNAVTPRAVFEGRAPQAPSAAVVAFRDALEEASASARAAQARREAGNQPVVTPTGTTVTPAPSPEISSEPLPEPKPATTTPLP